MQPTRTDKFEARQAYRLLATQVALSLLLAIFLCIHSVETGYSALLGGLSTALPMLIFIQCVFRSNTRREASKLLRDFYLGEALKFAIMIALVIFVLRFVPVHAGVYITGFLVAQFLSPFLAIFLKHKTAQRVSP